MCFDTLHQMRFFSKSGVRSLVHDSQPTTLIVVIEESSSTSEHVKGPVTVVFYVRI